jgi:hypothetical protein
MVDGVTMLPTSIYDEKGFFIPGYRQFPWLKEHGYLEPRADARCLTLRGEEEFCFARELDLGRPPEAFAYPLEQAWYIPTQDIATSPRLVVALPNVGKGSTDWSESDEYLENVPRMTAELREHYGAWAEEAAEALQAGTSPNIDPRLDHLDGETIITALCRVRASPITGRALILPHKMWSRDPSADPGEPVKIEQILQLDERGLSPIDPATLRTSLIDPADPRLSLTAADARRTLTDLLERSVQYPD